MFKEDFQSLLAVVFVMFSSYFRASVLIRDSSNFVSVAFSAFQLIVQSFVSREIKILEHQLFILKQQIIGCHESIGLFARRIGDISRAFFYRALDIRREQDLVR